MDNIERDVVAAMRLGYGVHYGRYKADHPHTKIEPEPEEIDVSDIKFISCGYCGKQFSPFLEGRSHNSKYCSRECYRNVGRERARSRYHRKGV